MTTPDFAHAVWRKSTHSGSNGGHCVELAFLGTAVGLRDSKDKANSPILIVTPGEWHAFLAEARHGEFSQR
ncbi:MAG: DUF397 domain-containing protein [Pseudonocardiaceae bacterium]